MDIAAVSEDTVIFDLSQVVINGAEVEFPVFISTGEDAFSLDFSMKFNLSKLQYDTTIVYPPELFNAANYNPNDQTLRFTSSSLDPIPNNVVLLTLKFHLLAGNHVTVNDFYNTSAFTNGTATEVKWITALCAGESLMLTASQNPGNTYLWSTGATTASITVNTADTYYASVTQGGSSFLSDITEVIISQFPDGNVIPGGPLVFCDEDSVILGAVAAGNSYVWNNGATTRNIVVKSTGTYSVNVTSPYGCTTASAQSNVTVNPLPNTVVNINGPTAFCEGDSTILQAVQSGNQYLWSNGATTQSVIIKTGGAYTVQITNGFGCTDESVPIPITVNPLPINTVSADGPLVFCAGESVNLTADATGSYTYLWSTGETSQFINPNYAIDQPDLLKRLCGITFPETV
ncbi:MAG: hypothetical protein KDD36_09915 [Flavobacteriales bacterium]|nr:hypothetical protein [Flavobacteriales bacterium]